MPGSLNAELEWRTEPAPQAERKGSLILLAHPDELVRARIYEALRMRQQNVVQMRSGRELIRFLATLWSLGQPLPRVIVAATHMPSWSGIDVAAGLAGSELRVPIVLIGAAEDPDAKQAVQRYRSCRLVEWPIDPQIFAHVLLREFPEPAHRAGATQGDTR